MCIFCAAIPMSAAMGAAIAGKQQEKRRQSQEIREELPIRNISVGKVTVVITGGLLVCSAVYHLVIMPNTGAVL